MPSFLVSSASVCSGARQRKLPGSDHAITKILTPTAPGSQEIYEPMIGKQRPTGAAFYITETQDSDQVIGSGAVREDVLIDTEILTVSDNDGNIIARATFKGMLMAGIHVDWIQPPPENYYMRVVFITGEDAEFDADTALEDYRRFFFQES
jgi:hypothetical protein